MDQTTSHPGPVCRKCGEPVPVNDEGIAPVYCDECANRAISRARRGLYTGTLRDFPVTTALMAINIAVFVAMVFSADSFVEALKETSPMDALRWGGNYGPYTLSGDYWRLLTACFVHDGILHVGLNMWCLWSLGRLSERYFGRWSTLAIYILTGIGGNLLSLAHNPNQFSVGASGAIFGIAGALIAGLMFGNISIPYGERRSVLTSVISFSAINFLLGTGYLGFGGRTDNMAHLGGFASGLLVGLPLASSLTRSAVLNRAIQIATLVITTALLSAAGAELANSQGPQIELFHALKNQDYASAIKIMEKETATKPNDGELQALLGYVYERNHEPAKAITAYKKALALDPKLSDVQESLRDLEQSTPAPEAAPK